MSIWGGSSISSAGASSEVTQSVSIDNNAGVTRQDLDDIISSIESIREDIGESSDTMNRSGNVYERINYLDDSISRSVGAGITDIETAIDIDGTSVLVPATLQNRYASAFTGKERISLPTSNVTTSIHNVLPVTIREGLQDLDMATTRARNLTLGRPDGVRTFEITAAGTGFTAGQTYAAQGGSGEEFSVRVRAADANGAILSADVANSGKDYQTDEQVTLTAGGTAATVKISGLIDDVHRKTETLGELGCSALPNDADVRGALRLLDRECLAIRALLAGNVTGDEAMAVPDETANPGALALNLGTGTLQTHLVQMRAAINVLRTAMGVATNSIPVPATAVTIRAGAPSLVGLADSTVVGHLQTIQEKLNHAIVEMDSIRLAQGNVHGSDTLPIAATSGSFNLDATGASVKDHLEKIRDALTGQTDEVLAIRNTLGSNPNSTIVEVPAVDSKSFNFNPVAGTVQTHLSTLRDEHARQKDEDGHIRLTLGTAGSDTHMGEFAEGSNGKFSVTNNQSMKAVAQEIIARLDAEAHNVDVLQAAVGTGQNNLGSFTPGTHNKISLASGATAKSTFQTLATFADEDSHLLDEEVATARQNEATLQANLDAETERATAAETRIRDTLGTSLNSTHLPNFSGATIPDHSTVHGALQVLESGMESNDSDIADIRASVGIADGDTHMKTFTPGEHSKFSVTANQTMKAAAQEIATQLDKEAHGVDNLQALSGRPENASDLGDFTGITIANGTTIKGALQTVETALDSNDTELNNLRAALSSTFSASATHMGTFSATPFGNIALPPNSTVKTVIKTVGDSTDLALQNTLNLQQLTGILPHNNNGEHNNHAQPPPSMTDLGQFDGSTIADGTSIKGALQTLETGMEANDSDIADIRTSLEIADGDTTMGSFDSTAHGKFSITANQTMKAVAQEMSLQLDKEAHGVDNLQALSGVAENATNLGSFNGNTISGSTTIKGALSEVEAELNDVQTLTGRPPHAMHMGTFSNGTTFTPTQNATTKRVLEDIASRLDSEAVLVDNAQAVVGVGSDTHLGTFSGRTITKNSTVKGALSEVEAELNDVQTLSGRPPHATHMGTFSNGTTFTPTQNATTKRVLEDIASRLDSEAVLVDNAQAAVGVGSATHLGLFSGTTLADNLTVKGALQSTEVAVEANDAELSNLRSAISSDFSASATDLGTFSPTQYGNVAIAPQSTVKSAIHAVAGITDLIFQKTLDLQQLTGIVGHQGGDEEGQPPQGPPPSMTDLGEFGGSTIPTNATVKSALQSVETAIESNDSDIATLKGLIDSSSTGTGVPSHLGSFSGGANGKLTFQANESVKNVLQHIETHADGTSQEVHNMQATVGVANGAATHLPTFSGTTIRADPTVKDALQDVETAIESNDGELLRIRQSIGLSSANDANMGTFSAGTKAGLTLEQDQTVKAISQSLLTLVDEESHQVDQLQALTGVVGGSSNLGAFQSNATKNFKITNNATVRSALVESSVAIDGTIQNTLNIVSTIGSEASIHLGEFAENVNNKYNLPQHATVHAALAHVGTALDAESQNVDDLQALVGASGATTLGTFDIKTNYSLTSTTVKTALQSNANEIDAESQARKDLNALSGKNPNATHHGTFLGNTIADASTTHAALQSLETAIESNDDELSNARSVLGAPASASSIGNFALGTIFAQNSTNVISTLSTLAAHGHTEAQKVEALQTLTGVSSMETSLGHLGGVLQHDATLTVKAAIDALASHAQTDQDLLTSTRNTIGMDSPTQTAVSGLTIPENASLSFNYAPTSNTVVGHFITTRNALAAQASEATNVRSALGATTDATHLGAFTAASGSVFQLSAGLTAKAALQSVADRVNTEAIHTDNLQSLMGSTNAQDLGTFTQNPHKVYILPPSLTVKNAMQALSAGIDATQHSIQEESTRAIGSEQANETKIDNETSRALAQEANIRSVLGVENGATDVGNFTGSTIGNTGSVRTALQDVETAIEANDAELGNLRQMVGATSSETHLGMFTGATIPDSATAKQALQSLETKVESEATALLHARSALGSGHNVSHLESFTQHAQFTFPSNATAKAVIQELGTQLGNTRVALQASAAVTGEETAGATSLSYPENADLDGKTVKQALSHIDGEVKDEAVRATAAETTLTNDIAALQSTISNILSNTDSTSLDSLTEIVASFQQADTDLTTLVNTKSGELSTRITSLLGTANSTLALTGLLNGETQVQPALIKCGNEITSENTRATAAEAALGARIDEIVSVNLGGSGESVVNKQNRTIPENTLETSASNPTSIFPTSATTVENSIKTLGQEVFTLKNSSVGTSGIIVSTTDSLFASANQTVKGAIDALGAEAHRVANEVVANLQTHEDDIAGLHTLSGITGTTLGSFDPFPNGKVSLAANLSIKGAVTALGTAIDAESHDRELLATELRAKDTAIESSVTTLTATTQTERTNIRSVLGVQPLATHLGTFTGGVYTNNSSVKTAFQETANAINASETAADKIRDAIGISAGDTALGTFSGTTIADNSTVSNALQTLETAAEAQVTATGTLTTAMGNNGNTMGSFTPRTEFSLSANKSAYSLLQEVGDQIDVNMTRRKQIQSLTGMAEGQTDLGAVPGLVDDHVTIREAVVSLSNFAQNQTQAVSALSTAVETSLADPSKVEIAESQSSFNYNPPANTVKGHFITARGGISANRDESTALRATLGTLTGAGHMGSFTPRPNFTVTADQNAKQVMQEVANRVDLESKEIDNVQAVVGVGSDTHLGAFSNRTHFTLPANATVKASLQSAATQIDLNAQNMAAEITRATNAENTNTQAIQAEAQRATAKEALLTSALGETAGSMAFTGTTLSGQSNAKAAIQAAGSAIDSNDVELANVRSVLGSGAASATTMGIFTRGANHTNRFAIGNGKTAKTIFEDVETFVDGESDALHHVQTLSGMPRGSTDLGTFSGRTIAGQKNVKEALQILESAVDSNDVDIDTLRSLVGNGSSSHLGTLSYANFGKYVIPADLTVKEAITHMADRLDDEAHAVDNVQVLSGVPANSTHLGTFEGDTIADNKTVKQALQTLENGMESNDLELSNLRSILGSGAAGSITSMGTFQNGSFGKFSIPADADVKGILQLTATNLDAALEAAHDLHTLSGVGPNAEHLGDFDGGSNGNYSVQSNKTIKEVLQLNATRIDEEAEAVDDLQDLTGVDKNATTLGTFTPGINGKYSVAANKTIKEVLQLNATRIDGEAHAVDNVQALVGVGSDTDLGEFGGSTITDGRTVKQALQILESGMESNDTELSNLRSILGSGAAGSITSMGTFQNGSFGKFTVSPNQDVKAILEHVAQNLDAEAEAVDDLQDLTGVDKNATTLGTFTPGINGNYSVAANKTIKEVLQLNATRIDEEAEAVDDLQDLTGVDKNATTLGTFTPGINGNYSVAENKTIKQVLQSNATRIDEEAEAVDDMQDLTGVDKNATTLGTFTPGINGKYSVAENKTIKQVLQLNATRIDEEAEAVDDLQDLTGVDKNATTLGTFTPGINGNYSVAENKTIKQVLQSNATRIDEEAEAVDDLQDLTGVDKNATTLGTFTPGINGNYSVAENKTIKQVLQSNATRIDEEAEAVDNVQALVGVGSDTDLGEFGGSTITDGRTVKQALQILESGMESNDTELDNLRSILGSGAAGVHHEHGNVPERILWKVYRLAQPGREGHP